MAALRRACLTTLIALVAQFSLGMIVNLYVPVPASDAHAGFIQEIKTAPFAITLHVLLGIVLIVAATVVLIRAGKVRDRPMVTLGVTGLTAILGAFAAGEMFVKNGESAASLWMAILTGGALVCYISALGRLSMAPGRRRIGTVPEDYGEPEPAYTSPAYAQPAYPQPGYAQPGYAQPGYAEPAYPQPAYAEPGYAEPVPLPRRAPQASGPWQTGPQRRLQSGYPPAPPAPPGPPWQPQPGTGPMPYRPEPPAWQHAGRQWPDDR
jgi:hypothetical protein